MILSYDESIDDGFIKSLNDIYKIEIYNDKEDKYICITQPENIIYIHVNKYNQIIGYYNTYADSIENSFLFHNETIEEISLPNVKTIDKYFLCYNNSLKRIYAPNLKRIGESALLFNRSLEEIYMPNLKTKKHRFIKEEKLKRK